MSRRTAIALDKDELAGKRQPAIQRSHSRPVGGTASSKLAATVTNVQKETSQQARRRGTQQRSKAAAKAEASQRAAVTSKDLGSNEKAKQHDDALMSGETDGKLVAPSTAQDAPIAVSRGQKRRQTKRELKDDSVMTT